MSYIDFDMARAAFYDYHQELKEEHEFLKAANELLKADYERLRGLYLREILPKTIDIWAASMDFYHLDRDIHEYWKRKRSRDVVMSTFELGASWAKQAAIDGQRNNNVSEFIDFEIAKRDFKIEAEKEAFRMGANYIFDQVLI